MKKFLSILLALLIALPLTAQEERTIKRKVAIGRFSNETQYAKGLFYDKENDPMRKQALDILSSKLAASGKFILLEREDLDILVNEAGADMNKIGADYIILGSITENTAVTDHIIAARKANYFIFRDIPRGKYSPDYMIDKDMPQRQRILLLE